MAQKHHFYNIHANMNMNIMTQKKLMPKIKLNSAFRDSTVRHYGQFMALGMKFSIIPKNQI